MAASPRVKSGSADLAPSLPLDLHDTDANNFDSLSALSPVCGQLSLPKADRLPSSKTGTLTKGCPGNPGRCMLESKASPNPSFSVSPAARLQALRRE